MKQNFIQNCLSAGLAGKLLGPLAPLLVAAGLATAPLGARAQVVLTGTAPKTENFDGLGTSATATVPTGVKLSGEAAPTYGSAANYTATSVASNGGATSTSNISTGGTYNFLSQAGSTDRALGFLNSGSFGTPRSILLAVNNNTGAAIQDLSVQFNLEKYRTGGREYNWTFYTSPDGVTWTAQAAGAQNYPADLQPGTTTANNATYYSPPQTIAKSVPLTGVTIANGATYYLRWTQLGVGGTVSGATNGQAAGLDDVTLTPTLAGGTTPPPSASISTGAVSPTSYCVTSAGSTLSVPFTTTGTLAGSYSVQLSDASGVFPASTTAGLIGSGSTSPIAATIPAGTPSGTGYRVRVLTTTPATTGTDNGSNLAVSQAPTSNPVTVAPATAQTVTTTGTGAPLLASTSATSTFAWQYGTSAGGPYSALAGATGATYQVRGADLPGAGTYYLVAQATTTTSCGSLTTTSAPVTVTVTAPAPTPALSVSATSLPAFSNVAAGAASLLQPFTVGGSALTGPITITPPAGFEIRTGATAFACCAIVLTPVNGTVPTTTIEGRFVPTASQAYAASISVATPGQPEQAVAVSGTGIDAVYPATLRTLATTDLTPTTAASGGSIATDGGSPVTARGVVWGKNPNPVLGLSKTVDGAGAGDFSSAITGLLPGTTYSVRAYATNGLGTSYGDELTFSTVAVPLADEPASPATGSASQVTGTSLVLRLSGGPSQKYLVLARLGSAVDASPTDATTYTADPAFGKGQVLGTGNYVVYNGTGNQVTITGLRPNTPYNFAVFAFNDNNTPYAENYLTASPGTLAQATLSLPATLLLEENFAYPVGALLTANNWSAHSGGGTRPIAVVAPGLSYAGYGPGSGNAAALVASGEDVNRPFAPVYARTPVYASFLVKVNSVTTTGDYFFNLGPQPIGSTYRARVSVRRDASGKLQFGISGGTGTTSYTPASYDLGATVLVVVKHAFDETGSTSQLFINPTTDTEPATADASQTETGTTPAAPNDNIGSVALRQGTTSPNLVVDGLRVGNSFRVVKTGLTCLPPAPAFTAAPVCAGSATTFTDASTTVEANATYAWDVNNDGIVDATTAGNLSYTYPAAGTYTAKLTITQGTCSDTYSQQVTVRALPTATLSGTATVCAGTASPLTVHLTGQAPWTVSYAANGGSATTLTVSAPDVDASGNYAFQVQPAATTTYALTAVADANCTAASPTGTAVVTVNMAPVLTVPAVLAATAAYGQPTAPVAFAASATGTPAPAITYAVTKNGATLPITSSYNFPIGTTTVTATATNDCSTVSQSFAVTVQATPASVRVLLQNANPNPASNTLRPNLQLANETATAIPYASLTVRYWLTVEDYAALQGTIDWAQPGTSNVKVRYIPLAQPYQGATGYVEYSFTSAAGSLPARGNSGPIQGRVYKQTYTNFNEADDYSYAPYSSAYAPAARITVYCNGILVGGTEPAPVAAITKLTILAENKAASPTSNTISTSLSVRNDGNTALAYQDLTIRYWFSPEGLQALSYYVDYAALGVANVRLTTGKAGSETYAELRLAPTLGSLAPFSSTGSVQYRIAKADWSGFNQANDFSYQVKGALLENPHITAYLQGQLIYGQEPAGAQPTAANARATTLADAAPAATQLAQAPVFEAAPNPFADQTELHFRAATTGPAQLLLYNPLGQVVQTIYSGNAEAGRDYRFTVLAADLGTGLYIGHLTADGKVQTVRLVLTR